MIYGYARVSTTDQTLDVQMAALQAAGCVVVRGEKKTGTTTNGRDELELVLSLLQPGDVLTVTRLDRLARSMRDLQNIVHTIRQRGASLRCTEQPVDMTTPAGTAFLNMLGVFAEFETALRAERQKEGIARSVALTPEKYKGRPKSVDREAVKAALLEGLTPTEISRKLGFARPHVYRIKKELEA